MLIEIIEAGDPDRRSPCKGLEFLAELLLVDADEDVAGIQIE